MSLIHIQSDYSIKATYNKRITNEKLGMRTCLQAALLSYYVLSYTVLNVRCIVCNYMFVCNGKRVQVDKLPFLF